MTFEQRRTLPLGNSSACWLRNAMVLCVDPSLHYSAQRNTYLTGFCLFLSLILTRTFYIILDLINTQDEYAKLKKQVREPLLR
jgi:hypothetical protein